MTFMKERPSYKALKKAFVAKEYYKLFIEELNNCFVRYYGKDESKVILKSLSTKKLEVMNPEVFFDHYLVFFDEAKSLYKKAENLHEFICSYAAFCKELIESGAGNIKLPLLFFVLPLFTTSKGKEYLKLVEMLLIELSTTSQADPRVTIQILDPSLCYAVKKEMAISLHMRHYYYAIHRFVAVYMQMQKSPNYKHLILPKLEIIRSIYKDDRSQVIYYLQDLFVVPLVKVKAIVEDVPTFTEDSSELRAAISILMSMKSEYSYDEEAIIEEVIRISNDRPFNIHPERSMAGGRTNPYFNNSEYYKICEHKCIPLSSYKIFTTPIQCEVRVDCGKFKSFNEMQGLIGQAAKILLVRHRVQCYRKAAKMVITLFNITFYSKDLTAEVSKITEALNSQYNNEFTVTIEFSEAFSKSTASTDNIEYIRVISDIHADVNAGKGYTFNFGSDFVVNCGDTAGTYTKAMDWIRANMVQGLTVIGNHLGYDYPYPELGILHKQNSRTIQSKKLNIALKDNLRLHLLGRRGKVQMQGIIFLGGTMRSDLMLYGEENFNFCKSVVTNSINDFKRCYRVNQNLEVVPYTIEDHLSDAKEDYILLRRQLNKIKRGPVVVVTHFAPLPFSIVDEYKNDPLSAYFASDFRELIKSNRKIKLWCHGHTHAKFDYIYRYKTKGNLWGETRVICNPFGYFNENNAELPDNYGTRVKIADIKSDKKWTDILAKEIEAGEIKVYTDADLP